MRNNECILIIWNEHKKMIEMFYSNLKAILTYRIAGIDKV